MCDKKILLIVEGEKDDVKLMNSLFELFGLNINYELVSYKTDIYDLYNRLFQEDDSEYLELTQVLKERNPMDSELLNQSFTDIILVFDYEPKSYHFSTESIEKMHSYFNESSDNGKLYINYPTVESTYHININNDEFASEKIDENQVKNYKSVVNKFNSGYRPMLTDVDKMKKVINQNLKKANVITNNTNDLYHPNLQDVLNRQNHIWDKSKELYTLSTCLFFITEYNSSLIK